jgi:hypothetical protein
VVERQRRQPLAGNAGLCADFEVEAGFRVEREIRRARAREDLINEWRMVKAPAFA